jgi:hypothetical protein
MCAKPFNFGACGNVRARLSLPCCYRQVFLGDFGTSALLGVRCFWEVGGTEGVH